MLYSLEMAIPVQSTGNTRQPAGYDELVTAGQQLDDVLAEETGTGADAWCLRLGAAAEATYAAIDTHRSGAEGPDGALADILVRKPALAFHAERQRREHAELYHRAKELSEEIERQLAFGETDPEVLRLEALVLRESLRLHVYRAVSLLYEAYFRDEGGED
ncbi:MAG: hypothetical protein U5Q44_01275 [Dehalococcoidia bacterium]|nr:hypothetical protein [Dehalococcoidia bacterium]